MEAIFKMLLGAGISFVIMSWVYKPESKIVTVYEEKECPIITPAPQKKSPNLEMAFQTCNQFLESYMKTVDNLQSEVKWLNVQILNCNDEIRFYRNNYDAENESESSSN